MLLIIFSRDVARVVDSKQKNYYLKFAVGYGRRRKIQFELFILTRKTKPYFSSIYVQPIGIILRMEFRLLLLSLSNSLPGMIENPHTASLLFC